MLKDKNVVIGISGGIAAYKAADIVSKLKKLHANVNVVMTRSACEFISPLTFQSLSQNYVVVDMFEQIKSWDIEHISLAQKADIFVVVPATANVIGKVANGIADDMLTTTIMATKSPVIFAPAMNTNMYGNPIVEQNITKLKSIGYSFIEPEYGRLACGDEGKGKLADNNYIVERIIQTIAFKKDMLNMNVLITAGPTREAIDPVRFITNHSSGKMGYAIARAAKYRGANVTLVTGPVNIEPIKDIKTIKVNSALEMYDSVMAEIETASIIIKAAAVSDYRPIKESSNKIKKENINFNIELTKNPDILSEIGRKIKNQVLVGFSMETENLERNSKEKLKRKNLDFIVANDLTVNGAGFGTDTNVVKIIDDKGNIENIDMITKEKLAHIILDKALKEKLLHF